MKNLLNKIKTAISNRPSNSILLLLTGFFFAQFTLINILYITNPSGGWVTSLGTFTTASVLIATLALLSLCLFSLWRAAAKSGTSEESMSNNVSMISIKNNFTPIEYPHGSAGGYTVKICA